MSHPALHTLGEVKRAGLQPESVRDELRRNLRDRLRRGDTDFPGIVGYEHTVLPALQNAILSRHSIILLGLRGQAKTRLARSLVNLLDEWSPVIAGSPLNCHPLAPRCAYAKRLVAEQGDETPITWRHRRDRYHEKLATPDVTMGDLIGDLDPIKAARERRDLTDEEVIAYGIIPRSNRGIFAINELPDLQARIQVGLLNILEENDLQIRGFPVRIPLDVVLIFTANPEDYTNRGNLITPLKDRIDSQILTHYPRSLEQARQITWQEAWTERETPVPMPDYFQNILESLAFVARESELVDKSSGVSARLSIAFLENVISNVERRQLRTSEAEAWPRFADLHAALPAVTGKIELAYEGEREGLAVVASSLLGKAILQAFRQLYPRLSKDDDKPVQDDPVYGRILGWFAKGNQLELSDDTPFDEHLAALRAIPGLETLAKKHLKPATPGAQALAMELVLEGLHQENLLGRETLDGLLRFTDMLATMLNK
jgi:magnesium chelatase subunit I